MAAKKTRRRIPSSAIDSEESRAQAWFAKLPPLPEKERAVAETFAAAWPLLNDEGRQRVARHILAMGVSSPVGGGRTAGSTDLEYILSSLRSQRRIAEQLRDRAVLDEEPEDRRRQEAEMARLDREIKRVRVEMRGGQRGGLNAYSMNPYQPPGDYRTPSPPSLFGDLGVFALAALAGAGASYGLGQATGSPRASVAGVLIVGMLGTAAVGAIDNKRYSSPTPEGWAAFRRLASVSLGTALGAGVVGFTTT
jgi:hypothetical protein